MNILSLTNWQSHVLSRVPEGHREHVPSNIREATMTLLKFFLLLLAPKPLEVIEAQEQETILIICPATGIVDEAGMVEEIDCSL